MALLIDLAGLARYVNKVFSVYWRDALLAELVGVHGAEVVSDVDSTWLDDYTITDGLAAWRAGRPMKERAESWEVAASDVLRNVLFVHLCGRLGYRPALHTGASAACRRKPELGISFSRRQRLPGEVPLVATRARFVRQYGKSGNAVKFWLTAAMKAALRAQAVAPNRRLSARSRLVILDAVLDRVYESWSAPIVKNGDENSSRESNQPPEVTISCGSPIP